MDLISLIIIIAAVGVLLWAINSFLPMDGRIKQLLNVVVVFALVIWILFQFVGRVSL